MMPATIFKSVDFPEPLRPIRHSRSPAETDSSTSARSGVPPNVSAMSFNWISGGAMIYRLVFRTRQIGMTAAIGERRVVPHRLLKCERKADHISLAYLPCHAHRFAYHRRKAIQHGNKP